MYVKTFRWLKNKETWDGAALPVKAFYFFRYFPRSIPWLVPGMTLNLVSNSVEDSHPVHARILYEFLSKENKRYPDSDILARDFFISKSDYERLDNQDLWDWNNKIGSYGFHLTTKHLAMKISDFEWSIDEIAGQLLLPLRDFFNNKSASKLREQDRNQCLKWLDLLETQMA